MKTRTNISIEENTFKKAQDAQINISAVAEKAIKEKLGEKIIQPNETLICAFCENEGIKETASDVAVSQMKTKEANLMGQFLPTAYSDKTKLTWLWPEEQWICNKCLFIKIKSISITKG